LKQLFVTNLAVNCAKLWRFSCISVFVGVLLIGDSQLFGKLVDKCALVDTVKPLGMNKHFASHTKLVQLPTINSSVFGVWELKPYVHRIIRSYERR